MTKEEYLDLLSSDKPEDFGKFLDMDDEEHERLFFEVTKNLPFNKIIPRIENSVLESALDETDGDTLAKALKSATEEAKEKIYSALPAAKLKEIRELYDFIGPQRFMEVVESQEKILKMFDKV